MANPAKNLGGPQAAMCYFAVQSEKFAERTKHFKREKRQRKEAKSSVSFAENQCIPAKSGEYHPLPIYGNFYYNIPGWP